MKKIIKKRDVSGELIKICAIRGNVLGIDLLRGYAKLSDLASISKADVYNKKINPTGTQRDLSPKHAKEAYEYVKTRNFAFWPEVFLCIRDKGSIRIENHNDEPSFCNIFIDKNKISKGSKIYISRVDGNHRLYYGNGLEKGYTPINKTVSFCLATNLTLEQEIQLFKDINDNQKRMNTSHLDNIDVRLASQKDLQLENPILYIAKKLGDDSTSPFFQKIYEGGTKVTNDLIPLRALKTGIKYMLSRSNKLPLLTNTNAQFKIIRNYFKAIKKLTPKAWTHPKDFIILRGAGLWAICYIGAYVIDKTLLNNEFKSEDMYKILNSGKKWDWGRLGDFKGYSGAGGATIIAQRVITEFNDGDKITAKTLLEKILNED